MTLAFILFNAEIGKETEVIKALKEISEVKESFLVYGVYDVIARVKAENMVELKDLMGSKIRRIENVRSTITLIVI